MGGKCLTAEISSNINPDATTSIKYENDDTLEIKDEIVQGMTKFVIKISYLKL